MTKLPIRIAIYITAWLFLASCQNGSTSDANLTPETMTSQQNMSQTKASLDPPKTENPCGHLTEKEATSIIGPLEYTPRRNDFGAAKVCDYDSNIGLSKVVIRTNRNAKDLDPLGGTYEDITINGRDAVKLYDTTTTCAIYFESDNHLIEVSFLHSTDGIDPCPYALQLAQLIEQRIP